MKIVFVGPDSEEEHHGWDADSIFSRSGINMASYEEPLFAAIDNEEETLGVLVGGLTGDADEGFLEFRFSVAVRRDARRKGVARALVRAMSDWFDGEAGDLSDAHQAHIELVAWVVNPHMADLLESEGFSSDGIRGWTPDAPMMRR